MRSLPEILYNFHWIVPGQAARSAQAYAGFLGPFLSVHGIRAVINLRGRNETHLWWRYEKRVSEKRGVAHFDAMLNSRRLPTGQMLLDVISAFDDAPKPMLIKCSGGQDRSSFAGALYILHTKGWSAFDEAMGQFARWPYLHRPKPLQRWLKAFFSFARQDANGLPIKNWIAQRYTDKRFKVWLEENGFAGGFRGLYLPGTAPGA